MGIGMYKSALLIDHNEIDIFIERSVIELSEFAKNIVVKNSSTAALDYLKENSNNVDLLPQYIFLDLYMPVNDGFQFLDSLSKMSETVKSNCKVIVLSVSINKDEINQLSRNENVYTIIQKPLSVKSLRELIVSNKIRVSVNL